MQPLFGNPGKDEAWYRLQWQGYYNLQTRFVRGALGALVVPVCLGIALAFAPDGFLKTHAFARYASILVCALALTRLAFLFPIYFEFATWDCPRCHQRFQGRATLGFSCQECGLRRPSRREAFGMRQDKLF